MLKKIVTFVINRWQLSSGECCQKAWNSWKLTLPAAAEWTFRCLTWVDSATTANEWHFPCSECRWVFEIPSNKNLFYFVHCSEWDYVMMPLCFGCKHNLVFSPWIDIKRPKSKARKLVNPSMDGLSSVTFVHWIIYVCAYCDVFIGL